MEQSRGAGWWSLRSEPRGRQVLASLREGQKVKLCSLLSKCPPACLLPRLPSLRLAAPPGQEAGRGPGAGRGRGSFLSSAGAPRSAGSPQSPGASSGGLPLPHSPRPVRSSASLVCLRGKEGVGLAKNAPSDPTSSGQVRRSGIPGAQTWGPWAGLSHSGGVCGLREIWPGDWMGGRGWGSGTSGRGQLWYLG